MQPAPYGSMALYGFHGKMGAGRLKPAGPGQKRRQNDLINPDKTHEHSSHFFSCRVCACARARRKCSSRTACFSFFIAFFGKSSMSMAGVMDFWKHRKRLLARRLALFRTTADPKLFRTTTENLDRSSELTTVKIEKKSVAMRRPSRCTV